MLYSKLLKKNGSRLLGHIIHLQKKYIYFKSKYRYVENDWLPRLAGRLSLTIPILTDKLCKYDFIRHISAHIVLGNHRIKYPCSM